MMLSILYEMDMDMIYWRPTEYMIAMIMYEMNILSTVSTVSTDMKMNMDDMVFYLLLHEQL